MILRFLNSPISHILNIWDAKLQIFCSFNINLFDNIPKIVV